MAAILVNAMNPKRTRRRFTAAFKAEVALAALTERHPLAELATRYQLSVEQISRWKTQLRQQAAQVFTEPSVAVTTGPDVEPLYAAIGRLQMENALLKKNAGAMCVAQQRALVQASGEGSVQARCQALGLARSSFYYQPCGESAYNLHLMRLLDEEFTDHNFKGVLGLRDHLRLAGHAVNEKRVRRLVRLMGHEPVYPKPRLSVPGQGVTPYPYLLRGRPATAPNEVWSTDITYIPMAQGFLYLVAVLDWHARYVLSWELSNTLDVGFCLTALHTALVQHPAPFIFNSDQGSQFTSLAYEQALLAAGCRISRDGRGRATDNAFIERLWRSVKWECIYLNPATDGQHLYQQLEAYFTYYNHHRPHQALKGQTPAQVFAQTPTFNPSSICLTNAI